MKNRNNFQVLRSINQIFNDQIVSLKTSIKSSFIFSNQSEVKIFGYLLFLTVLVHIFAWRIMNMTNGEIWVFGNRTLRQAELYHLTIDGGYLEHFQYIILMWCSALSFLICFKQNK